MRKIDKALLAVVAIAAISFIVWYTLRQPTAYLGRGLPALKPLVPRSAADLYTSATESYRQYRANAGRWSAVYFGCTFGAAVLSASAGVVLKLDSLSKHPTLQKDLAATFAACAALLITLSTTGSFEAKWRANRLAASDMEAVIYKLAQPPVDNATILSEMSAINRRQNESVAGSQVVVRPLTTDTARKQAPIVPDTSKSAKP